MKIGFIAGFGFLEDITFFKKNIKKEKRPLGALELF